MPHLHQGHRGIFFQDTGWLAKSIAFNLAALRIRSVFVDLRALER